MRRIRDGIWFYVAIGVCNVMTWGMFSVLNMPRFDVAAATSTAVVRSANVHHFTATTGTPVRVSVPSLGIDVKVDKGTFDASTEEWTLSDQVAFFASGSMPANDSNGTTLIYGHARAEMFEPLADITDGARAEVYTDNSKLFIYTFSSMREVIPTDTSVFSDVGPPAVVLQTCSGPWDQYRALYSFDFDEVKYL